MKRFLSFVLAVVLVIGLVPVRADAAKGGKLVALTFDDGPHSTRTEQLLDGLKERDVKVTFFMLGYMAEDNMDIVQRAYDEGHEVANHSWDHPDLTGLSTSSVQRQISRTNDVLDGACGEGTSYLVRPPYGSTNSSVRAAISAPLIYWSVDTNDWRYGYSHVYNHIIDNAYDGSIILCHDIHSTTIPAALDAIDVLLARGYEFVTVSELYRRRGVQMQNGVLHYNCKANGTDLGSVEAPKITYKSVSNGVQVTISSPSDAPVYYSTDGSKLNQESKRYTGSFVVDKPCTIKAVAAFNMNGGRSEEVSVRIEKIPCNAPTIELVDGKIKLSTTSKDAQIFFTINGKVPTTGSTLYTDPREFNRGVLIRAVAGGGYYNLSKETKAYYSENGDLYADVMPYMWYADAVIQAAEMGLLLGVGDYSYMPEGDMSRGMLVTLLYRSSDVKTGNGSKTPFTDVSADKWYGPAVAWAYRNNIVKGYPGNVFLPDRMVTRQEMAQIVANYFVFRGNPLPEGEDCSSLFTDSSQIADWAKDSVDAVAAAGLLKGDDLQRLRPEDTVTRAEFCTVILRMIDLEQKIEQEKQEAQEIQNPEPVFPTEPPIYILPTETTALEVMSE